MNRLQNKALAAANEIMNVLGKGTPPEIAKARKVAESVFGEGWDAKAEGIYSDGPKESKIWGIGQ
jgi:alpha-mannosidase